MTAVRLLALCIVLSGCAMQLQVTAFRGQAKADASAVTASVATDIKTVETLQALATKLDIPLDKLLGLLIALEPQHHPILPARVPVGPPEAM